MIMSVRPSFASSWRASIILASVDSSTALVALPMAVSGVLLLRNGVETRGRALEDIQRALRP